MIKQPWKLLGFVWAFPVTLLGLLYVAVLGAKWLRWATEDWSFHFYCPDGAHGQRWLLHFNVGAQTVGSLVVYARSAWGAPESRLAKHEQVHVRQGMRYGVFHPLFYALMSVLAWMYGQDIYRGNEAEEQARYDSGEVAEPDDLKPKDHSGGKL